MGDLDQHAGMLRLCGLAILLALIVPGCAAVPSSRLGESQRLTQNLRAENARLQDQVLGLQAQNRDAADRALDDLRRLSARDEAIERLERSVRAYQDDRDRLAEAYQRLASSLDRPTDPSLERTKATGPDENAGDH
jgi:chromosome segregation ATPase